MKDRWVKVQSGNTIVLLDTELTPDLIREGIVNDIKRAIQILRKKRNYEINNHIIIWIWTDNIVDIKHQCDMATIMIPLPHTLDCITTYESKHSGKLIRIAISEFSDLIQKETLCDRMYLLIDNIKISRLQIAIERVPWRN